MKKKFCIIVFVMAAITPFVLNGELRAQQPPPQFPNMSFFITSTGGPEGADYGGIAGADAHCQALAAKAGAGAKTWRAYLSVQAVGGATAVKRARPSIRRNTLEKQMIERIKGH